MANKTFENIAELKKHVLRLEKYAELMSKQMAADCPTHDVVESFGDINGACNCIHLVASVIATQFMHLMEGYHAEQDIADMYG